MNIAIKSCPFFVAYWNHNRHRHRLHHNHHHYTGWCKKNACFSNNCNFVYFQYKKIMSTPKQPVINAVLVTYINHSITEDYIGKMASFLPYTRPESLLTVLHHIH